jgi:hypothetical protein
MDPASLLRESNRKIEKKYRTEVITVDIHLTRLLYRGEHFKEHQAEDTCGSHAGRHTHTT